MSIGRAPKSSPPGIDRRTRPQRVSSGPSTLIDARIRSTSSYGATGVRSPSLRQRQPARRPAPCVRTPIASSSSPMIDTSTIDGTFVSSYVAVGEDRRRHQLEHGVLGAGHVDRAVQLADPTDDDLPPAGSVVMSAPS